MQDDPPKSPPVADVPPAEENPLLANLAWAKDLRDLYNTVVEEPLPDSFLALLSQLDTPD